MKPRLAFVNGYWSWAFEEVHKTGYTCFVCAGRDAVALASRENERRVERKLMRMRMELDTRRFEAMRATLPEAIPSDPEKVFERPGAIIDGNYGDPGFPPKRNWFRRLLDRIF